MISAVATIWIPPSAMNTPAWIATARAVIKTDASSHTSNASRLMPAEQWALIRWESCGTYAPPASPTPTKPATSGTDHASAREPLCLILDCAGNLGQGGRANSEPSGCCGLPCSPPLVPAIGDQCAVTG